MRSRSVQRESPQFLAVGVVAVTYKWKHQTLFSIAAGTLVYMILLANL